MKKHILIQTQLSNYNLQGKFDLAADSGWQMTINRAREMLKLNRDLHIDILGPFESQLVASPFDVNPDLFDQYKDRLVYIQHWIIPNALATRYDFDFEGLSYILFGGNRGIRYDAVYINDPMHLRNFKALFYLKAGYRPRFFVHSHFVDVPNCPKFPVETSLWYGQCEASLKADYNFWQCQAALDEFEREVKKLYVPSVVNDIMKKSAVWDDGYSNTEINLPINYDNIRFNCDDFKKMCRQSCVIFLPNRIGEEGRSSDYTFCGKFMFEVLPKLHAIRDDFVVIAGNPSQKILNDELEKRCGKYNYIKLTDDSFNRDEYRLIAKHAMIAVGLYAEDTFGGTAARECVDLGCIPFWSDIHSYKNLAIESGWNRGYMCQPDLTDAHTTLAALVGKIVSGKDEDICVGLKRLQAVVRERCSYECTTIPAMKIMDLEG